MVEPRAFSAQRQVKNKKPRTPVWNIKLSSAPSSVYMLFAYNHFALYCCMHTMKNTFVRMARRLWLNARVLNTKLGAKKKYTHTRARRSVMENEHKRFVDSHHIAHKSFIKQSPQTCIFSSHTKTMPKSYNENNTRAMVIVFTRSYAVLLMHICQRQYQNQNV